MYRITQFDVPKSTPIKSIAFYNQVFGWTFQPSSNQKKWTARVRSTKQNIIGNPFQKDAKKYHALTNSIEVSNLDRSLKAIKKEGGQIVVSKFAIPGVGWMAYFKDLEQNVFGLMQSDIKAR